MNIKNKDKVDNKYCIMTVVEMLQTCRDEYVKEMSAFNAHKDGLIARYYGLADIPKNISDEVSELFADIAECTQRVEDIDRAIKTVSLLP